MISAPQADLRHTGHVGYDGAIFGDVAFIGQDYERLPVKVHTPRELWSYLFSVQFIGVTYFVFYLVLHILCYILCYFFVFVYIYIYFVLYYCYIFSHWKFTRQLFWISLIKGFRNWWMFLRCLLGLKLTLFVYLSKIRCPSCHLVLMQLSLQAQN